MKPPTTCAHCRFYTPNEPATGDCGGPSKGDCHRHPPAGDGYTNLEIDQFVPDFPQTRSDTYCGEFQPKTLKHTTL